MAAPYLRAPVQTSGQTHSPSLGLLQSNGGGALFDVIVRAVIHALEVLFAPIEGFIEQYGNEVVAIIVTTPQPNAVFAAPTNGAWPAVYEYYWSTIIPLAMLLYALALGLVILLESTSHLFSSYHKSKLKKRALSGLLGILAWWWIAALSLRFMNALTGLIVPDLSSVTLFQTTSFAGMGTLGLVVALATDFTLIAMVGLIYLIRQVVLYLYVLLMPLLIVLWIPGVGPFRMVAHLMKRLARLYVPFLFMTLPIALLFRLGELLGSSFSLTMGGFGAWLLALVIPVVAVISPLVFFWQASALFLVADRIGSRVGNGRGRNRLRRVKHRGRAAASAGGRARSAAGRLRGTLDPSSDSGDDPPSDGYDASSDWRGDDRWEDGPRETGEFGSPSDDPSDDWSSDWATADDWPDWDNDDQTDAGHRGYDASDTATDEPADSSDRGERSKSTSGRARDTSSSTADETRSDDDDEESDERTRFYP